MGSAGGGRKRCRLLPCHLGITHATSLVSSCPGGWCVVGVVGVGGCWLSDEELEDAELEVTTGHLDAIAAAGVVVP